MIHSARDVPVGNGSLQLGRVPTVMGIVNTTPDSFSDGGDFATTDAAVAHALQLVGEGADIVDIGGESTRPGSDEIGPQQELDRVMPVLDGLAASGTQALFSIDTY